MNSGLMNFYLLYYAWDEPEEIGVNYYFDGADLDNMEEVLKKEAKKWIEKYVNGKEGIETEQESAEEKVKDKANNKIQSWWKKLWF